MRIALILDSLHTLKPHKDSSLAMMREAASRGHELFVALQDDLFLRQEQARLRAQSFEFVDDENWFVVGDYIEHAPQDFDVVLMRKDPPFDNEFLYTTYLLELAVKQGARVLNNPSAIRDWNEKLSVANFPQFSPEFLVARDNALIREFLRAHGDIVVKPLDGMGGSSIFRLTQLDPNISVILETITDYGKRTVMAQRYLPEITQGDKRIIVINGEPLPYALARIPLSLIHI